MADPDPDREKDEETGAQAAGERDSSASRPTLGGKAASRRPMGEFDAPAARGPAAYVAEFIGTFVLVLAICFAFVLYAPPDIPAAQPGGQPIDVYQDFGIIGLIHAFVLFGMIQAFAIASGAHFNPAVTTALAAIRQIRLIDAAIYIVLQVLGGIAAAAVVKLMLNNDSAGAGTPFGAPDIGDQAGNDVPVALGAEVIGTFILVLVIMGVAVNPRGVKDWAGWAIGATLGLVVMMVGPLSGGSFNPARAFGPSLLGDFAEDTNAIQWILVYVVGPLLGALLAAFLYFQTVILPGRKGTEGMDPVG